MKPDQDPGWDLRILIPFYGVARAKKQPVSGVGQMRYLFTAFAAAICMFGFVLSMMGSKEDPLPTLGSAGLSWSALAIAAALLAAVVVSLVARRPLDVSNAESLSRSYRNRFFVCIALAEPIAIAAFVGALVTGDRLIYYATAPLTLLAFYLAAPTRGHIERDHEAIRQRGSLLSIYEAMSGPTAS